MDESASPQSCYATPAPLEPEEVRAKVTATAIARGESLEQLSEIIGCEPAYLRQYVEHRSPSSLPEDVRLALAQYWHMDERELGARDPWRPIGNGDLIDAIAASIWLRGTPDWAWEDAPEWWRNNYRAHVEVMLAELRRRGLFAGDLT